MLQKNFNNAVGEKGLDHFFTEQVGKGNFPKVKERMRLIEEDRWSMTVYLARPLEDEQGRVLDGEVIWEEYKALLGDYTMPYAEKRIRLSNVKSRMNYFIYQIKRNENLIYNDKIGEIFYIADGMKYFNKGKLNREKIQGELGEFIDFI